MNGTWGTTDQCVMFWQLRFSTAGWCHGKWILCIPTANQRDGRRISCGQAKTEISPPWEIEMGQRPAHSELSHRAYNADTFNMRNT